MAKVPNGVETLPKISTGWVGCTDVTDRQTDRQTDDRRTGDNIIIANMNVSSRSLKITCPNFTKFSVHLKCCHCSDILWQQCTTLCTSGFMNDDMFTHNRPGKDDAVTPMVSTVSDSVVGSTGAKSTIVLCYNLKRAICCRVQNA